MKRKNPLWHLLFFPNPFPITGIVFIFIGVIYATVISKLSESWQFAYVGISVAFYIIFADFRDFVVKGLYKEYKMD